MIFKDQYAFLSNMYYAQLEYDGITFEASEIAYMYAKCSDKDQALKMSEIKNPFEAKKFGRTIKLKDHWDAIKLSYMDEVVTRKFQQNPYLLRMLKAVEGEIVEHNHWGDTYWGICKGKGENNLGKILMSIREKL